jgi:hypothetical protein
MAAISGSARTVFAVVWISALAGCGSANYAAPIKTFADATADADTALVDLNKTTTDRYTAYLAERVRANRDINVAISRDECADRSKRCRIALEGIDGAGNREFYPPDPLLGNSVALMGDIRAYAQNLAALVADDSAAKATADVNATLGSVEKLANTLTEADGKPKGSVPSFATPVGAAVNWAIGEYAERVKLAGLRQATKAADPVIQRAGDIFAKETIFGSQSRRIELEKAFKQKLDAFRFNRADQSKLDDAVAAAKRFDELLQAQPDTTFKKMGEAHKALTDALNNSNVSWSEAFAKAQEFAAKAQQLAKITQDLIALNQKK